MKPKKRIPKQGKNKNQLRLEKQIKGTWFHLWVWAAFLILSLLRGYGIPSGYGYYIAFIAVILLGLGVAIYMVVTVSKSGQPKSPRWWLVTASLLLLSLSLFTRIPALNDFSSEALEGDPIQYIHEAKNTPLGLTFLAQKSPGYDFIVLFAGKIAGWEAPMMRGLALLLSVSWIPFLLVLGRRLIGQKAAFVAAAVFVTLPSFSWMAVRGLREDLSLTVVLLLLIVFLKLHEEVTRRRAVAYVVLCAVLLFIRFDALPFLGLAALIAFIVTKELRRTMAISAGVLLLIFAISSYAQQVSYGSFSYHSNMYARWFANQEYVGQPGFPKLNASGGMDDSYAGPKISLADYVIGMHSPGVLAGRAVGHTFVKFPVIGAFFWLEQSPRLGGETAMIGESHSFARAAYVYQATLDPASFQPGAASQALGSTTLEEALILIACISFFVLWIAGLVMFLKSEFWIIALIPVAAFFGLFYLPTNIFPPRVVMYAFPLMVLLSVLALRRLRGLAPPSTKRPDPITGSVW